MVSCTLRCVTLTQDTHGTSFCRLPKGQTYWEYLAVMTHHLHLDHKNQTSEISGFKDGVNRVT